MLHEERKQSQTYWSRLITLSPSSLISGLVTVDGDGGVGLLLLTCADFCEASAIKALLCSSSLQFSPSYTTLEIKQTFKASESTRKCLMENTLESFPISDRNRETPIEEKREEQRSLNDKKQTLKLWNMECDALISELRKIPRRTPEIFIHVRKSSEVSWWSKTLKCKGATQTRNKQTNSEKRREQREGKRKRKKKERIHAMGRS